MNKPENKNRDNSVKNTVNNLMNIRQFSWYGLGLIIFMFIGLLGVGIGVFITKLLIEMNIK